MSKQDDLFNRTVFDQFDADWDDIRDNPIPWKNIFNLNASTTFELDRIDLLCLKPSLGKLVMAALHLPTC